MYDFPPYRPPSEANSALLRVTRGCPWNRCLFCGMYRGVKFELRPFDEIAEEIKMMDGIFPSCRTVFIGDSNSLLHKDILKVVKLIKETLPEVERITSYARAHTLNIKKEEQLKALKEAGLSRVHVGLESGDEAILKSIHKGATPEIMIKGGCKAKQAGFELFYYVLCGIGGDAFWQEHADGTAQVINAVNPNFIRLRTLTLVPNAPLYEAMKAGDFTPITPLNRLKETKRMIELLEVSCCELASDHVTNHLWAPEGMIYNGVDGLLPRDKGKMTAILEDVIEQISDRDDIVDANTLVQQGVIQNL